MENVLDGLKLFKVCCNGLKINIISTKNCWILTKLILGKRYSGDLTTKYSGDFEWSKVGRLWNGLDFE